MQQRGDKVYAKDMIPGVIYAATPVGDFTRDTDGRFYLSFNGHKREVRPHKSSLVTVKGLKDDTAGVADNRMGPSPR